MYLSVKVTRMKSKQLQIKTKHNIITLVLALYLLMFSCLTFSKNGGQTLEVLSSSSSITTANNKSTPNSSVTLDFSVKAAESWDKKDSPNNIISTCIQGDVITGVEFINVKLETFNESYFSESVIYFSNSVQNDDGLRLAIGSRNDASGVSLFNSNGILDISDSGNDDIIATNSRQFFIQFYELIDDVVGEIDSKYSDGVLKVYGVNLSIGDTCEFVETLTLTDVSVNYQATSPLQQVSITSQVDFNFLVKNEGNALAKNLVVNGFLSTNMEYTEMSCGSTSATDNSPLMVNIPQLAMNESFECKLSAIVTAAGALQASLSVTLDNENNLDNNAVSYSRFGASFIVPTFGISSLVVLFLLLWLMGLFIIRIKLNKQA